MVTGWAVYLGWRPSHITAEQVVGFGLTMGKLVLSGHIDEVVDTIEANIRHI
jgi:hypothetical protein